MNQANQPIYVVFRYDDCSSFSSLFVEGKLIELFQRYQAGCAFGVIPYINFDGASKREPVPLPEEKVKILRKATLESKIEIALHGLSHVKRQNRFAEFEALPKDEQIEKVKLGKDTLERLIGAKITTFIPPWNIYDDATIQALKIAGIDILSASLNGPATAQKIYLLPATCNILQFQKIFLWAEELKGPQIIVIGGHAFEFHESGSGRSCINLDEFTNLIQWCKSKDNLRLVSIKEAVEENKERLDMRRFIANKRLRKISRLVKRTPIIYIFRPNMNVYWSKKYCSGFQRTYQLLLAVSLFIAVIILFILIAALKIIRQ